MKHQILDPVHNYNYSGHHGIDKTSAVIKRCFGQKCQVSNVVSRIANDVRLQKLSYQQSLIAHKPLKILDIYKYFT